MAPSGRRKKTAVNGESTAEAAANSELAENDTHEGVEEKCPACKDGTDENKETWICCDACKTWFHVACVDNLKGVDFDQIDKW